MRASARRRCQRTTVRVSRATVATNATAPANDRQRRPTRSGCTIVGLRPSHLDSAREEALEEHGVEVVERVPLVMPSNPVNRDYLRTKANRMGHLIAFEG